jgi:hypothetical protein
MNQIKTRNPLLSKFDRDPGRYRPWKYGAIVEVPVEADESGENTIELMNQPFTMDRISHSIIGPTHDPAATGLSDDGQYFIEWREEQSQYQNEPLLAKAAYGTEAFPLYLSAPLTFPGNKTLTFRVTNAYTRVLTPISDVYKVQIVIHGIADWGTDAPPER